RVHYTVTTTTPHQHQQQPKHRLHQYQQATRFLLKHHHISDTMIVPKPNSAPKSNPQPGTTTSLHLPHTVWSVLPVTTPNHRPRPPPQTCSSALFDVPPTHHTTPANTLSASTNHHVAHSIS